MENAESQPDPRVDATWVNAHIDDPEIRFVEVDVSPAAYKAGHIRGAVLWNAYSDLRHPDYQPASTAELEDILSRSGVTPELTVAFYGYGAHLGSWLLKSHGHRSVRIMDGGREQYKTEATWSSEVPIPARSHYVLGPQNASFASKERIKAGIGKPDRIVIDTRSKAEYDGERFWPSGGMEASGRAGHIPGAVHIPIDLLRSDDGIFKSPDELQRVMSAHGITPAMEVATYCTIGNRASQAWFALTYFLGYPNASVYYGSWAEWGKAADMPVDPENPS